MPGPDKDHDFNRSITEELLNERHARRGHDQSPGRNDTKYRVEAEERGELIPTTPEAVERFEQTPEGRAVLLAEALRMIRDVHEYYRKHGEYPKWTYIGPAYANFEVWAVEVARRGLSDARVS